MSADAISEVGTFLKLWTTDGECWGLQPHEESRVDAAVSLWLDSAETRDTLLLLTLSGGDVFKVRASLCGSWMLSTPEGRRREWEISKAGDEERRAIKAALGDWDEPA